MRTSQSLSWFGIARIGLAQAALGAIVVLTTSTLNRVMVVELALAAFVPGALVTLHHAMQALRPRMGFGSDVDRRRTPWVLGGMTALAVGGVAATCSTALMAQNLALGLVCAAISYALIGGGVSAAGTSLLVLMAQRVAPERRAAASTMVWMMMIASFAITAGTTGRLMDPFSFPKLITISVVVSVIGLVATFLAMWGLETGETTTAEPEASRPSFAHALKQVWGEPDARRFTLFVLVSMLSYSAQDLILEPFAGAVFHWTPGQTTSLSGTQHGGVFVGMLLVALVTSRFKDTPLASVRGWVVGGCLASGVAMAGLVVAGLRDGHGLLGGTWPLSANVFVLGVANGAFSIAAIASMMTLANEGARRHEGTRMGVFGAAQALGFGAGGFLGTVLVDAGRLFVSTHQVGVPYAFVFALEMVGFFVAQWIALRTSFPKHEVGAVSYQATGA